MYVIVNLKQMPSLSDQRKLRIEDLVEYGKKYKNSIILYDKVFVYCRKKYPTLTTKTIQDYTKTAIRIIIEDYSQELRPE